AFLFTWGVLVWFRSRVQYLQVASGWIYKISRHPQYLGWILWSYGFILFSPFTQSMKITWNIPSSLPWLLMTMTIIGICMLEEIRMVRLAGAGYERYRAKAPFLMPIPSWLNKIVGWPARQITGGGYPVRRIQVLWIVLLYSVIFMALSLFWVDVRPLRKENVRDAEQTEQLSTIVAGLDQAGDDRRAVYAQMEKIPLYGEAGTEVLMTLSGHPNPDVREFSIQFLGEQQCTAAENIFLRALSDSVRRVRSSAIIASSILTSERAIDSLVGLRVHPAVPNNLFHIYGTLGAMGDARAIPYLARGLKEEAWFNQRAALNAIMEIDPAAGVAYAISELKDTDVNVRRNAVMQCILSRNPQVVDPLSELFEDPDFEVRFYARQGVRLLTK
ncbi:MAG: HEAT repeat domain-containing protein, partial [Bacteroidales bacterium]